MEAFSAGTLAGAGSFRCEGCGFAVALQERDALPSCPHCRTGRFKRASIFTDLEIEPEGAPDLDRPEWLAEARDALVEEGQYVAFEAGARIHVVPLKEEWTRIGRSLAAHLRFDDPTVSRRHALVHRESSSARILDDRSLNGVFVNGERVDWRELHDGDVITIGRFRLFFISLTGSASPEGRDEVSAVG